MIPRPPISTLFPYTTLFRSVPDHHHRCIRDSDQSPFAFRLHEAYLALASGTARSPFFRTGPSLRRCCSESTLPRDGPDSSDRKVLLSGKPWTSSRSLSQDSSPSARRSNPDTNHPSPYLLRAET